MEYLEVRVDTKLENIEVLQALLSQFSFDSFVEDEFTKLFVVDAFVEKQFTEQFTINATLTTVPVPYRYINTHLHDIIPIVNSTASGVQIKTDSILINRKDTTVSIDAFVRKLTPKDSSQLFWQT